MVGKNRSDMFGELLQAANNTGDLRSCPVRHYFHWQDSSARRGSVHALLPDAGTVCTTVTFALLGMKLFV